MLALKIQKSLLIRQKITWCCYLYVMTKKHLLEELTVTQFKWSEQY